jgi:hypothetical protein
MKKYLNAILVLLLALGLLYYLYDESAIGVRKSKERYDSVQTEIDGLKAQRDSFTNQIVGLSRGVQDSADFLGQWRTHYAENRDFEAAFGRVAEKSGCAVVERKWDAKTLSVGNLEYDVNEFSGMVVGDYRDIIKFIGILETTLQLSTIWQLEFKEGVSGVTCSIVVYFPKLEFEGVPL